MPEIIDLRSDTVTLPSQEMRHAMAIAPVGDDQFGEDPTINLLQDRIADLLGKESALWLPSGTMANQVALRSLTRPGDDVIVSKGCHAVWHETGGSAANSGVQFTEIGHQGTFAPEEFQAAIKPHGHIIYPPTTLVEIENTHNRAGGIVFPQRVVDQVCNIASNHRIATYLDGARLWNASIASGQPPSTIAAPFDLVSVSLSKGLGAPGGSLLSGNNDIIHKCMRYRRMFGGAMRQVGIFAAAGIYAIDHHMERLAEDHENARFFARRLSEHDKVDLDLDTVQTNIVIFNLSGNGPDAATIVNMAKERGVLIFAFGKNTVRAVTHKDVSRNQCKNAADILCSILDE